MLLGGRWRRVPLACQCSYCCRCTWHTWIRLTKNLASMFMPLSCRPLVVCDNPAGASREGIGEVHHQWLAVLPARLVVDDVPSLGRLERRQLGLGNRAVDLGFVLGLGLDRPLSDDFEV